MTNVGQPTEPAWLMRSASTNNTSEDDGADNVEDEESNDQHTNSAQIYACHGAGYVTRENVEDMSGYACCKS